jgi:hypothetical protein
MSHVTVEPPGRKANGTDESQPEGCEKIPGYRFH